MSLYHFFKRQLPGPGAQAYAFTQAQSLPGVDPMGFTQYNVRSPLMVFQHPQVAINAAIPTAGYGGIVAGTVALQGLLNTNNPTG